LRLIGRKKRKEKKEGKKGRKKRKEKKEGERASGARDKVGKMYRRPRVESEPLAGSGFTAQVAPEIRNWSGRS
jgi:hypothetical protein